MGPGTGKVRPMKNKMVFVKHIVNYAKFRGWRVYVKTGNHEDSNGGFPDLVLVRSPDIVVGKVVMAEKDLSDGAKLWLSDMARTLGGKSVCIWRPTAMPEIVHRLK